MFLHFLFCENHLPGVLNDRLAEPLPPPWMMVILPPCPLRRGVLGPCLCPRTMLCPEDWVSSLSSHRPYLCARECQSHPRPLPVLRFHRPEISWRGPGCMSVLSVSPVGLGAGGKGDSPGRFISIFTCRSPCIKGVHVSV